MLLVTTKDFPFFKREGDVEGAHLHELRFDGCYMLKTDLPLDFASKELVHDHYKNLTMMDQTFRAMKTAHLHIRPVYLSLAERTLTHVFVIILAYMITRNSRLAGRV